MLIRSSSFFQPPAWIAFSINLQWLSHFRISELYWLCLFGLYLNENLKIHGESTSVSPGNSYSCSHELYEEYFEKLHEYLSSIIPNSHIQEVNIELSN